MTITDTGKDEETPLVIENRFVWPQDEDSNIVYPSWGVDEQKPSWWGYEQKKKSQT